MIIGLILYLGLGWLMSLAINHAADILPKRQTFWQRPVYPASTDPRPVWQWSALLTALRRPADRLKWGAPRFFYRAVAVELITPALLAVAWWQVGPSVYLVLVTLYTGLLVLITATDLEYRLILNVVMGPALLLALVGMFLTPLDGFWNAPPECRGLLYGFYGLVFPIPTAFWQEALLGGFVGFALSFVAWLVAILIYGPGALGQGDVTLSLFLGLILGFPYILLTFLLTILIGGIVPIFLMLLGRVNRRSYIPYGPFLTITGWAMLLFGNEIWRYYFC